MDFLGEVQKRGETLAKERADQEAEKEAKLVKRMIEYVLDKSKWSYDVKEKKFLHATSYMLRRLKDSELSDLFNVHLHRQMISCEREEGCHCMLFECGCTIIYRIKFKE